MANLRNVSVKHCIYEGYIILCENPVEVELLNKDSVSCGYYCNVHGEIRLKELNKIEESQ